MPILDIIIGPMNAGKTTELIRRINLLKVLNKNYLIVKPVIDDRYSSNHIVTHNSVKEKCINLSDIEKLIQYPLGGINTIFIDEAQFFQNLYNVVIKIVEEFDINVVVCGLNGDSNRNKFGEILDLIPICDNITKIDALCQICLDGTPGIFSNRLSNKTEQICVGNQFNSLCRKHFLEQNR